MYICLGYLRNIPNILCVIRNPPKMLQLAQNVPNIEQNIAKYDSDSSWASPPTTMIPDIAFVTDISGVCSAGSTDQTR